MHCSISTKVGSDLVSQHGAILANAHPEHIVASCIPEMIKKLIDSVLVQCKH